MSSYHYVKLSADEYPRLYATPNLRDDGSYYAGPFRKASLARRFVDCVNGAYPLRTCAHLPRGAREHACQRAGTGACLSPCSRPLNGEYAAVVDDVRRVPRGPRRRARRRLRRAPGGARQGARVRAGGAPAEPARDAGARAARRARLRAAQRDDAGARLPGATGAAGSRCGRCAAAASSSSARSAAVRSARRPRRPSSPSWPRPSRRGRRCRRRRIDEMLLVHSWTDAHRAAPNVVDLRAFLGGPRGSRRRRRPPPARRPAGRLERTGAGWRGLAARRRPCGAGAPGAAAR